MEADKYESYKKKLQGICDENDLIFRFRNDTYPITLTIKPVSGKAEQMSMLNNDQENEQTSPEAAIVFSFKDGELEYKTSKTFTISDALFSKIKNLYKNMHYFWLQFFYRDVIEKINKGTLTFKDLPRIDEGEYTPGTGGAITEEQLAGTEPLEIEDNPLDESGDIGEESLDEMEGIEEDGGPVEIQDDEQISPLDDNYPYEEPEESEQKINEP